MDLSHLTGTELLRRAGYGHAQLPNTPKTGRHLIYRLDSGEPLAPMDAHEASGFAIAMLTRGALRFPGWTNDLPRMGDPSVTAALRILAKAAKTVLGDGSEEDLAGAGLDAALDNADRVLAALDSQVAVPTKADTDDERADLVSEALAAAVDVFGGAGVTFAPKTLDHLHGALTDALDELHPVDRATRLGVDPRLIHGGE